MDINNAGRAFKKGLTNNGPLILTGLAVAGLLTTVTLAVRATPRALWLLDNDREDQEDVHEHFKKYTFLEMAKIAYKPYIPAVVMGVVTAGCIVGAHSVHTRKNAALISAYSLVDTGFKEYKAKVAEQIGENKERKVREEIAADRIQNIDPEEYEKLEGLPGQQLCYDKLSGRLFMSDIESIRKAMNDINYEVTHNFYATQNDFYALIGLEPISIGDELGWNSSNMMDLQFSSHLTPDNRTALAVDYRHLPSRNFDTFR